MGCTIRNDKLERTSDILKPGKAAGLDILSNEMISCLVISKPQIVLKLFNTISECNEVIPDWVISIINPIHKSAIIIIIIYSCKRACSG